MIKKTNHLIWYFNITYVNNVIRRDEYDMHRRTTGVSQYTNTLNKDFFFYYLQKVWRNLNISGNVWGETRPPSECSV